MYFPGLNNNKWTAWGWVFLCCVLAATAGCAQGGEPGTECGDGVCNGDETPLSCPEDCTGGTCGNGVREGNEPCDGADLGGQSCTDLGFAGGVLSCSAVCQFDTAGCTTPVNCGNGQIDQGEDCDGANLNGQTCAGLGFAGGTLACAAACTFDTSGCQSGQCGNGQIDAGEECDGANLNGQNCAGLGFVGGTLTCTGSCTFDTSGCQSASCGNNSAEAGEDCDGSDLAGQTCQDHGFTGGTLACTGSCTFDTSGCVNTQCTLSEGFESGLMPPTGWERINTNPRQNWQVGTFDPHGGTYNAEVEYDDLLGVQDEVLISPEIVCSNMTIAFWGNGSHHWAVVEGNYDVALWVVVGAWGGADDHLITNTILADLGTFTNWIWYPISYPIPSSFDNQSIRIAWQYHGSDGAAFYLDDVQLQ